MAGIGWSAATGLGDTFDRDPAFELVSFWAGRAAEFVREMLRDTITIRLSPIGVPRTGCGSSTGSR